MDHIQQQALSRRTELLKQREAIDAEVAKLDDFLAMYGTFKAPSNAQEVGKKFGRLRKAPAPKILAGALKILEDRQPRTTRAILVQLREGGMDAKGKDDTKKVVYLSQILGRFRDQGDSTLKFDTETRLWSLADKAPKSKSPTDVTASAGPDLRGNSTISAQA